MMDQIILTDDNIDEVAEVSGYPRLALENMLTDFKARGVYSVIVPLFPEVDDAPHP